MAAYTAIDHQVYVGGHDLTGYRNSVTVDLSVDPKDSTVFGQTSRTRLGGLNDGSFQHEGWLDAVAVDAEMFADLGVERVFTVAPTSDDGAVGYFGRGRGFSYQQMAQVGEIVQANGSAQISDGVGAVRGFALLEKQTITGDTSGTVVELGTLAATENLYTVIHVFTAGTTCDVIVESDDASAMSTATERSNTTVTAVGGTWVTPVAGAITDTHFRVRTENVTGTFSIAVFVGIR